MYSFIERPDLFEVFYELDSFDDKHYEVLGTPYFIGASKGDEYDRTGPDYYMSGEIFTLQEKILDSDSDIFGANPDDILPGVIKELETFINGKFDEYKGRMRS